MNAKPKFAQYDALTQALTATILGRLRGVSPITIAADRYAPDAESTRALLASLGASGGFLVPSELSSDFFIDALRPLSVVRRHVPKANFISMPHGNISVGRADSAPATGWINEDAPQQMAAAPGFGQVEMMTRKAWATAPVSNSLLRFEAPGLEGVVLGQLLKNLAATEDAAFINGNGGLQPKGIMVSAGTTNTATSSPTPAQVTSDLQGLVSALETKNVPTHAAVFLTTPAGREYLTSLTAAGSGNWQFPTLSEPGKTIFGLPMEVSNNVPAGAVILVAASEILIAQSFMDVSLRDGLYTDVNGVKQSSFENDEKLIRIISGVDIALQHSASAAVLTGASWA
jgi:HK97 family phage major capsid protein